MSKRNVRKSSYVLFERKMTRKMLSLVLISIGAVFLLRELIRGRFGDSVVAFLTGVFHLDYSDALYIYEATFRNNLDSIIAAAIIIALIIVFRYSIRWVTEYFDEISSGCDALLDKKTELITLSPEMGFLELKLNESKTILEKREQDAREAEQRKNDLVVYLAHDIRTPLTSVIGYLELLKEAPDLPLEQRAKYLSITLDKAYRLEQLINEFFEITRFNLQSIPLNRENIRLSYMLMQMAEEFYPILAPGGKSVHLDVPEDLILPGDPDKLARVFNNILKNAAAYSYPDTVIEIRARQEDNLIRITFTNQGPQIPPGQLNAIFEKFYRLDSARSSATGGAGLGLAIAKEIVTAHQGTISAQSSEEGTIFTIDLPAFIKTEPDTSSGSSSSASSSTSATASSGISPGQKPKPGRSRQEKQVSK